MPAVSFLEINIVGTGTCHHPPKKLPKKFPNGLPEKLLPYPPLLPLDPLDPLDPLFVYAGPVVFGDFSAPMTAVSVILRVPR